MRRCPPTSTLFPYTTLFRSKGQKIAIRRRSAGGPSAEAIHHEGYQADNRRRAQHMAPWLPAIGDRKSTRLNSSHRCTSYAVFCLKKKNSSNHSSSRRKTETI